MKKVLALTLLLATSATLRAQVPVTLQKNQATNQLTPASSPLVVGNGQTITVASGGTLTMASGSTFTPAPGSNLVTTNGAYADPAWLTSLAWSKLTGVPAAGSVTSVGLALPDLFTVTGSPVTTSGTLTASFATGKTANYFLATPNGSTGAVALRPLVPEDVPTLTLAKISDAGTAATKAISYFQTPQTSAAGYGIVNGSTIDAWGAVTPPGSQVFTSKPAHYVLASPFGGSGVPTMRALDATDIPFPTTSANSFLGNNTGSAASAVSLSASAAKSLLAISAGDISGLGNSATRNVGVIAGTVAAGDDPRFHLLFNTLGETIFAGSGGNPTILSGNTTTTRKFYQQTGTGTISAAPAWDTLVNGDVPAALTGKSYNGVTTSGSGTLANSGTSALTGFTGTGTSSGSNTGDQTITLTGAVTGTGTGSFATTLANSIVSNANVNAAAAIALSKLAATTASRALVSDGSGLISPATTTATEIGYVNGVTSAIQTQLNGKESNLTFTSPLARSVNAISIPVASGSVNGYLSSADWTTFNAKQTAGNYITALTGDATAAGPGSAALTLATVGAGGTVGSSTAIPVVTFNAKGLTTGVTTAAVVAPAGTLTGATLATGVTASSLTSAAGGTFGKIAYQNGVLVNVKDFGAYGDSPTHDDTTAIQSAITYATTNGGKVYLPAGNYKITAALDLTAGHLSFIGENRNRTAVIQFTSNTQILKLGGYENTVSDLTLTYNSAQAAVNTTAIAIEIYGVAWSVVERLTINNATYGMYVKQAAVVSGANWIFSCSIRDLIIQTYSVTALHFNAYNGGISGNVVSNVYILGRDAGGTPMDTNEAIYLGAWTDGVFEQINIESTNPTEAIYLNTCEATVWNGLHFEVVKPRTDFGGFINASTGAHTFTDVSFSTSTINTAGGVYAFRASGINTKIMVSGLKESGSTVTSPMFRIFGLPGTETGCLMHLVSGNYDGFTSAGFSASSPSKILGVNETFYSFTCTGPVTGSSFNGVTITAPASSATLTIANGKTLTASNTLAFTGTDSSSVNFGAGGIVLYSGGSYVSSITGTSNEITASASTGAITLSLPSALTLTGKTITGGTYTGVSSFSTTGQITSTLATGTSPFSIASTTVVSNLNAALLNGATFAAPGTIGGTTPGAGLFTSVNANTAAITAGFNSAGSHFVAYRNTPTSFGDGGGIDFATQNASSAQFTQGRIVGRTGSNTAGSEDGQLWFYTRNAGVSTTALKLIGTGTAQFQVGITVAGTSTLTGGIVGVTDASSATAGNTGQIITSAVAVGSAVSLTTATGANVTSISLTAGDWDVSGNVNFAATTATVTGASGGITTTSATVPTDGTEVYSGVQVTLLSENDAVTLPRKQINVSGTTTVYLVGKCTFTAGSVSAFGAITARRVR